MNFEHVCARVGWLYIAVLVAALILTALYLWDSDFGKCKKAKIVSAFCILSITGGVLLPQEIEGTPWYIQGCYAGMFIYLTVAGVMDYGLQMVCDFLHGIGLISSGILAFCNSMRPEIGWSFLAFCLIQYFIFRYMYGPADVSVFMVCALFLAATGRDMEAYLLHMAVTFLLLGLVQILQKNINSRGNLKKPVALIPYMVISFFLII